MTTIEVSCLWVPIAERKPPITEEYIVAGNGAVTVMTYNAEHGKWLFEAGLPFPIPMDEEHLEFTHWMALPAAPAI